MPQQSMWRSMEGFSSVKDGIYTLGKAHIRSIPSLRISPTLPLKQFLCSSNWRRYFLVLSRTEDHQVLSLSAPLSSRLLMAWHSDHGLLSAGGVSFKLLNTPDHPTCKPLVAVVLLAIVSAQSFPFTKDYKYMYVFIIFAFTPARPGLYHRRFRRWISNLPVWASHSTVHFLLHVHCFFFGGRGE